MNRVRVKDLALVAAAGGLLAFELVSIGEVLPNVTKALADRGRSERVEIASASAVGVPLPVLEPAAPIESPAPMVAPAQMVSPAPMVSPARMVSAAGAQAAKRHATMATVATSAAPSKRCIAMARARDGRRAHERLRVVKVTADGSCVVCAAAPTVEKRREIEKAVNLVAKQSTL